MLAFELTPGPSLEKLIFTHIFSVHVIRIKSLPSVSLAPAGASQVNTGRQAGGTNSTHRSEPRQGRSQTGAA